MTRLAPSGRFIYAAFTTAERRKARFDDMCSEGELSPSDAEFETIRDHRNHVTAYVVTLEQV